MELSFANVLKIAGLTCLVMFAGNQLAARVPAARNLLRGGGQSAST